MFSNPENLKSRLVKIINKDPSLLLDLGITSGLYREAYKIYPASHKAGNGVHWKIYPVTKNIQNTIQTFMTKKHVLQTK
jgi:hypothetical protein